MSALGNITSISYLVVNKEAGLQDKKGKWDSRKATFVILGAVSELAALVSGLLLYRPFIQENPTSRKLCGCLFAGSTILSEIFINKWKQRSQASSFIPSSSKCGFLSNYFATHHASRLTFLSGLLCVFAAIELAGRTLHNLGQTISGGQPDGRLVSSNLGGAVLLAACASNAIPGLAKLAALGFTLHATQTSLAPHALRITKAIRVFQPLVDALGEVTIKTIGVLFTRIIPKLASAIGIPLGFLFNTVLKSSPEASAAIAVIGAIAIYTLRKRSSPPPKTG